MTRFDRDTALTPVADGVFAGAFDRAWWIVRGPNGGHVAAVVLRAMTMAVDDPSRAPRSLTIHYTRPGAEGPFEVHTSVERAGRSVSTVSARLVQDGRLAALALGAFSVPWEAPEFSDLAMPEVPAPEDVPDRGDRPELPFLSNFDFRWVIGVAPMGSGGKAESGAWMRLREPRLDDHLSVAQFTDAWAPAVFSKFVPPTGVPTVDLTIHFREPLPLPGASPGDWVLGVFRTTTAREGFIEEDGEIWSRDGRLVAQSRQLAIVLGV